VTGDWVFYVTYRRVNCQIGVETLLPEGTVATLFAPRPNPSRAGTSCDFVVPQSGLVSVAVFDVNGRLVRELASGWRPAGRHSVSWDGTDSRGARAPAGLYVVELSAGSEHSTRKVTLTE
jgi:flagellar hook assembly protein FlgD